MDIKSPFGGSRKGSGKDETFKNMIRYGTISSINPKLGSARVSFADKSGVVSHDLPVLVPGSLQNKHYHMPSVGENVLCIFLPNGIQRGFILGSFYNVNNAPPVTSATKDHITYSDGTVTEYDSSTHTMMINCVGTINVTAPTVNINASGGDVLVSGISLKSHIHSGVQSGSSNTGGPAG